MVTLSGGTPIILPTKKEDGYLINPLDLRRMLEKHQSNVKLLVLCNPSNPTGGVHDAKRLQEIAMVLTDFPKVVVLADEIYERLVYDNLQHVCFASLPNMMERTITVNGMSKAYAMTGYRLGYLCAPKSIAKACTTIQSQITSCASSISQAAGVAALTLVSEEEMQKNVSIMCQKRNYVISQLKNMEGVTLDVVPNGAFYLMPDVSAFYDGDDTQLCIDLLKKQKLALVPGSSFGAPGTVRLSYATSMEELELAMNKLKQFLVECRHQS
jgi:aspartate/methionine/tyrosine aminotransferase